MPAGSAASGLCAGLRSFIVSAAKQSYDPNLQLFFGRGVHCPFLTVSTAALAGLNIVDSV